MMDLQVGTVTELGLDGGRVREFYENYWPRKIALSNTQFYNWQFRSVPSAPNVDNCVVAYDSSRGQIGGIMGLNARPFSLGDVSRRGAELTTWIVQDKYRAHGAGAKILPYIQRSYDVLIGMGITEVALSVYMRCGFRFLSAIPRFVKVFDFDAVAAISKHTPLARKLVQRWARAPDVKTYSVSDGLKSDVDAILDRTRKRFNLFVRDREHLRWRYEDHPFFRYQIFNVRRKDGDGCALVCLREETAIEGIRIVHVLDCFGDDNAIPSALGFVEDYCAENQFHVADFYCTSALVNRFFLAAGWFAMLDDRCLQFPHLFHPIELRIPPTTSLTYWSKDSASECYDFSKLYITKQDADLDRPVLEIPAEP
jgi:hypothetical protein